MRVETATRESKLMLQSMNRVPKLRPPGGRCVIAVLPLVVLLSLSCGDSNTFKLAGVVEREAVELAAPVSEEIVSVPVQLGQRVEADTIVVQLDSKVAEAELRAAEAAKAAADATLTAAEGEYVRLEGLKKARVASASEFDRARRARDEALAVAAEREARVTQASERLDDMTIRTHASGVVDQLPFEEGERPPVGGVVAVVVSDEKPWVRVWLPARAVARVDAATRVEVEIVGLSEVFQGRVQDIAREAEFTPHYALTERESAHLVYRTRVLIENGPADLRPGLPAQVKLITGSSG